MGWAPHAQAEGVQGWGCHMGEVAFTGDPAAQADWTRSVGVEEAGLLSAPSPGNSHPWSAPHLYSSFSFD